MREETFSCDVVERAESVRIVLGGELDVAGAPTLVDVVRDVIARGHRDVVVDMLGLGFVDSTGLRALLVARRAVEEVAGDLAFTRSTPDVERLFAVTHFDSVFRFVHGTS